MIESNFITGLNMDKEDEEILRLIFKHNPFLKAIVWNKHYYKIQRVYGLYPQDVYQMVQYDPKHELNMGRYVTDFFKNHREWLNYEHGVIIPRFDSFKELKMKYELYGIS